jgi:hypothetical protein
MSEPISIETFQVNGNHRTRLSFMEDAFGEAAKSQHIHELYTSLGKATSRLESLGIFSYVDAKIVVTDPDSKVTPHVVKVLVDVKEKNVPYLKVVDVVLISEVIISFRWAAISGVKEIMSALQPKVLFATPLGSEKL